jgi:homoserine O-acetyltransferase
VSLEDAFLRIKDNLHLISFSGDTLFFPQEMRDIKNYMDKVGGKCNYFEIESDYGHDSFLVEIDKFDYIISDILKGEINGRF